MAAAVSEKGYADTTVADIVRIARTSRRTFYEHFNDRADCFLALGEAISAHLRARVAEAASAASREGDWRIQIDRALDAYLQALAANPGLTRSFVLELFGMGARGFAHKRKVLTRMAEQLRDLVEAGRKQYPDLNPISLETAMAILSGIWELALLMTDENPTHTPDEIRQIAAQLISDVLTAPRERG
jgi:AcrR family transcriptional regulator